MYIITSENYVLYIYFIKLKKCIPLWAAHSLFFSKLQSRATKGAKASAQSIPPRASVPVADATSVAPPGGGSDSGGGGGATAPVTRGGCTVTVTTRTSNVGGNGGATATTAASLRTHTAAAVAMTASVNPPLGDSSREGSGAGAGDEMEFVTDDEEDSSAYSSGHRSKDASADDDDAADVEQVYTDSSLFLKGLTSHNPQNDYQEHFAASGNRPQNYIL